VKDALVGAKRVEKALGKDHQSILTNLSNLSSVLHKKKRDVAEEDRIRLGFDQHKFLKCRNGMRERKRQGIMQRRRGSSSAMGDDCGNKITLSVK
jgi:hypothetical protein